MKKKLLFCAASLLLLVLLFAYAKSSAIKHDKKDASSSSQNSEYSSDDFWDIGKKSEENDESDEDSEIMIEHADNQEDNLPELPSSEVITEIITAAEGADRDSNSGKRVVCWGDSLTEGTGGEGVTMPGTIAELSGAEVLNYGVFGETSTCIAARQGSNPQYTVEETLIPSDQTPAKAQTSGNYGYEMLLVFGNAGINNAFLNGVEGTFAFDEEGNRCFTRLTPGDPVTVPAGTQLITHAMLDKKDDDIAVFWVGSNDTFESDDDINGLIDRIDKMIEYHGNDKYIVVSLTARHNFISLVDSINDSLHKTYGEHYVDIRSFLVNDSLGYIGIEPTDKDLEALSRDDIPYSIRASMDEEENHGNPDFYRIAGELVYRRIRELGYLN